MSTAAEKYKNMKVKELQGRVIRNIIEGEIESRNLNNF